MLIDPSDGTLYYEYQSAGVDPSDVASNKSNMDMQSTITGFQRLFNGRFPFTSDGVIIGTPDASFEEEMETKITFAGGQLGSLRTFAHENMHQWWGDNVAESLFRYTFFKEGMARLGEYVWSARTAANDAGGLGAPAGEAAFNTSLVNQFNTNYANTGSMWTSAPSNPTANSLFARWRKLLQDTQRDFGGGSISEAQWEAQYKKYILNQSPACAAKLDQFFTQWWDTAYPTGGGLNKPQITGPGLNGPGFYDAGGSCSKQFPPVTTATVTNGSLSFTATDDGAGAGSTFYSLDGAPFQVYTTPIPLSGGTHTVVFYSTDAQGNQEGAQTQTFTLSTSTTGTVSGTVPATLALTLGAPASFGPFTPGVTRDYTASTTANVVSTAGDATLSVADPSTNAPGHLVNGAFSLPSALQASASSPGGTAARAGSVGAAPLTLETWRAPVSNDPVTIAFTQHIASTDALRTGSYSKTLTFTLSTTTP